MTPLALGLVAATGLVVGMLNAVAGAGAILTFPLMVGLGLSPLAANVTNCVGVVPGSIAATIRLRGDLRGQGRTLRKVVPPAAIGSVLGVILLFTLPSKVFDYAAPGLLALGAVLVLTQPLLAKKLRAVAPHRNKPALTASMLANGAYGGYFGAGVGIIFAALLGLLVTDDAHRMNALKNVLQTVANGVAGLIFCFTAPVNWPAAIVLAATTAIGGPLGARLARHLPATALRSVIGVLGLITASTLMLRAF
ncbi:sulfite exporter TauE/SafE family protein [Kutzneria sp. CA-103260]|uniref:sulfite exporter TauE/SafE family protein n=1 Tax=Kutzneria sp. CA-103260 TaxID=2802641 RepID=UPI001BADB9B2|nr:sulfite exporter TauE/SafE family protein [Kutzneria sp. CA-103260]QUQ68486.1 sulfite exporter TauE/SafE family protein [Kutzneria sp. CA-103260]